MKNLVRLEAGLLAIEFRKAADRYVHQVFAGHGGEERLLLESLEGGSDDPWPPSPPLQELHAERQADGRQVVMLIGRAGRSHWSLSVEPVDNRLVFDVACRLSREADWLGSSYRTTSGTAVEGGVVTLAGGLLGTMSADFDGASLSLNAGVLQICAACGAAPGPRTARWRYVIGSR